MAAADPDLDVEWWNRANLHTYRHDRTPADDESVTCFRHPDTGAPWVLRREASRTFLMLWDDGLGAPVIPCPYHPAPPLPPSPFEKRAPRG